MGSIKSNAMRIRCALFLSVIAVMLISCVVFKKREIDSDIYGTWKESFSTVTHFNGLKDTTSITLTSDSLKDSICGFYAFYENKTWEYFEINGINSKKIVYQKGDLSTNTDDYCLSGSCCYDIKVNNDTLKFCWLGDPGYEEHYRKFPICWTEN
jgi:hypothetical protein